jgi:signal transduction histidine kinase
MSATETITIVDDTEGTRYALRRTLEKEGYEVVEGGSAADALRLAAALPSLLILDVHLPDGNGMDVARRIKADPATATVPILQLSASYVEEHDRASGLEAGADAYLTEPVSRELLLATIRALLRARAGERAAERAVASRDELLSMASHDMRGLLHSLKLTLELQLRRAQAREVDGDALARSITRSVESVQRMTRVVEDLLDRSQIQAGKLVLQLAEGDLVAIVSRVLDSWRDAAAQLRSEIVFDAPAQLPGRFDTVRLSQILANLLSNALKYAAGAPVRVRVRRIDDAAEIAVSDSGPGIPATEHERIFARFERADGARQGSYGLGLWIARDLARLHGGDITVESAEGAGATFLVRIPV